MQKKLRLIVKGKKDLVFGLTVSSETATMFSGCYFRETRSGNCIIFESGINSKPTPEDIANYKFEDVKINS